MRNREHFATMRKLVLIPSCEEIQVHILSRLLATRLCQGARRASSQLCQVNSLTLRSRCSPTQIPEGALRNRRDRFASKYHHRGRVGAS